MLIEAKSLLYQGCDCSREVCYDSNDKLKMKIENGISIYCGLEAEQMYVLLLLTTSDLTMKDCRCVIQQNVYELLICIGRVQCKKKETYLMNAGAAVFSGFN